MEIERILNLLTFSRMKRALLTLGIIGAFFAASAQVKHDNHDGHNHSHDHGTHTTTTTPSTTAPNPNAPVFKFETEEYNFGTVKQGEVVNYEFKFVNAGKENLVINQANGSCGCTVPNFTKDPVKPGESGTIKVTFNSTGKSGPQDRTVTLNSNAGTKILRLKGTVEPKPTEEPFPTKKSMDGAPVERQ